MYNTEAKLNVTICFNKNEAYLVQEIPLKGVVGSCKLDVLDSHFPLILQPRTTRMMSLKNSGCVSVSAIAEVVHSKENQSECRDFCVCPNNIVLSGGEKLALQISYKPENNKTDNER